MSALLRSALALAATLALAAAPPQQPPQPQPDAAPPRFTWVDVHLDPAGAELAAWQVELVDPSGRARFVGVEGGAHPAYAAPPYYDPAALADGERLVLAAFHTGAALDGGLPTEPLRVARVHVQVRGAGPVPFEIDVQAAAGPREEPLRAAASLVHGE